MRVSTMLATVALATSCYGMHDAVDGGTDGASEAPPAVYCEQRVLHLESDVPCGVAAECCTGRIVEVLDCAGVLEIDALTRVRLASNRAAPIHATDHVASSRSTVHFT